MTQGANISLQINTGENLSYAIDKKLDTDLGVDVKLGLSEWNSVFSLIKSEQVPTNKDQFGENDTDIRNGRHYVVHEGTYEITNNIWTKIVDIAKKKMGITTEAAQPVENPEEANDNKTAKETVTAILSEAGLSADGLDIDDIVNKYNNLSQYYTTNNIEKDSRGLTVNDRLVNYVKALQTHKTEAQFAQAYENNTETSDLKIEINGVKEAIASFDGRTQASYDEAMKKQNDAFHQAAIEHIELHDTDNDGKINVQEIMAQSIKDEETRLGRSLTADEKETIKNSAINRVALLDQNDDNVLDENEMAAFVWASAKVNDTDTHKSASDITYDEWVTTQETMTLFDFEDLSQEEIDKVAKFRQTLENGYNELKR